MGTINHHTLRHHYFGTPQPLDMFLRCWANWGLDWLLELVSFSPSGHWCGVWTLGEPGAGFQPIMEKWKGKRRKKEGSDPCNHRADLSSVPAFRADLEGNNNQGHSGKRMQDRLPPGKTHWLHFSDWNNWFSRQRKCGRFNLFGEEVLLLHGKCLLVTCWETQI